MASISAGVGPRIGWDEVTIYMKRMEKLPLRRAAAVIARKTVSLWETTNGKPADRQAFWKYFQRHMQETGRPDGLRQGMPAL